MTADANSVATASAARKPATAGKSRVALFIATAAGLGYIPFAPGTFGSLAGVVVALVPFWGLYGALLIAVSRAGILAAPRDWVTVTTSPVDPLLCLQLVSAVLVAVIGTWSAGRAAAFWGTKDPQRVVIDEVSGQHLALLLGCGLPIASTMIASDYTWQLRMVGFGLVTARTALNWKYLLLGFILFRVFDIWKPFPVRQAERLPGGWGIMADDWVAALYAALGLWIARAAGL